MTLPQRIRTAIAVGLMAAVVALAGCSSTDKPAVDPTDTASTTEPGTPTAPVESPAGVIPAGFEEIYNQDVDWVKCAGGVFHCADIAVPLDWNDPESPSITIAAQRYDARQEAQGTILINPGGPGGSGIDLVGFIPTIFGKELLENYNVLGFDPRGVGQSEPVTCLEPAEMDKFLSASFGDMTEELLEKVIAEQTKFAQACADNSGDILGFVDTQSAAKDMDLIRSVVGDEKLNYLGYSYGTQLGATYAGIFPDNVGRMVLDGAIDLRLTAHDQSLQQAVGFENALRAFVTDCQSRDSCPLTGSVDDGMDQIGAMLDGLLTNPMRTDDESRVLTQTLGFYAIAQPLYAEQLWAVLRSALTEALAANDGSALLELSDSYFGRAEDGTYMDNSFEAFAAINCLDTRGDDDFATMEKEAAEIVDAAPVMGQFFGFGGSACTGWPYPQAEQDFDLAATGAEPIMVIGTTNDPATPYVWAQGLAEQLDSGFLVTHVGEGHTAYGMGSQCIVETVDDFFVNGTVPDEDPNCN